MGATTYGYVRVSTKEQNEARQVIAMRNFGIEEQHIFIEKQSGKDFNRPQYKKLIRRIRVRDILVIKSIYRSHRAKSCRNHRTVANHYERKAGGNCCVGHALARHTAGSRPDRHTDC